MVLKHLTEILFAVTLALAIASCSERKTASTEAKKTISPEERRASTRKQLQGSLEKFLTDGNRPEAKEAFRKCAEQDPSYAEPRYNLARLEEADENWDEALRWYNECQRAAPNSTLSRDAGVHIRQLEAIQQRAQTPEGARALKYETLVERVRSAIAAEQFAQAEVLAEQAAKIDDSRHEAYSLAAAVCSRNRDYDKALGHLRIAISKCPADKKPSLQLALSEMEKELAAEQHRTKAMKAMADGQFSAAAREFESAWQARSSFEGYGIRAALAHQLAGANDAAIKLLRRLASSKDLSVAQLATNQLMQIQKNTAQQTAMQSGPDQTELDTSRPPTSSSDSASRSSTQTQPPTALPGERFPETRTRHLSDSEASALTYAKLRYAINEMYARYGAEFLTRPEVRRQFDQFSWYRPQGGLSLDAIEAKFSDIERANLELLAKYRDAKKP